MPLLQSWLFLSEYAIFVLYLWLTFAYALGTKRSGQRYWWLSVLAWFSWFYLLGLNRLMQKEQFRGFPIVVNLIVLLAPIVVIIFHLFGKGRFPGYSHPRDVLLFRRPHIPPSPRHRATRETLGISIVACSATLLSVAGFGLRPCQWLDRAIGMSGCTHVLLYDGLIQDLAFSPGGAQLAIATDDDVRMWDTTDGRLILSIPYEIGARAVAFSPDGELLATGGREHQIQIRRLDGTNLRQVPTNDYAESIAFSPDGRLISAGVGSSVEVWRTNDWSHLRSLPTPDEVYSIAFSPNGEFLAAASYGGTITVWRGADGVMLRTIPSSTTYQLTFSPDSTMLASAAFGDRVYVWRVADGKQVWLSVGPATQELMWSVAFSPNGTYMLGGSGNHTVRLWQTSDFALLATLTFDDQVHNIAVRPDNRSLAIGLWDGTVRLWRLPQ